MFKLIYAAAVLLVFSGCSMFQPQPRNAAPISVQEQFSLYSASENGPSQWWEAFENQELNSLVEEALSGNFNLRTTWSRLKQADAIARQAGAALKPSIDYSAGAGKSWQHAKVDGGESTQTDSETYSAGLAAAYELDLWGRLNALRQAEGLELQAAREDLEAAAISVAGEVVNTWVDILSIRNQIAILEDQIRINQRMLKLQELRFVNGQADALNISQQREALAKAKASLPTLQREEELQTNALAVLLGRAGSGGLNISQIDLPDLIALPAAGIPADLLSSRPDVRAAGLRLKEADWQVSAARADRLPSITLSAETVFSSNAIDLLFNNWVATLASSITGPLFDAGYKSAEVDRTKAVAEEYLTAYAQTVAQAIQEVEESLVTEKHQGEYIKLLQDQLKATRLTLKDANIQYMNGQDNYLDYLTAWASVQELERQLVREKATLIKNRVTLYRTLGNDWTKSLVS